MIRYYNNKDGFWSKEFDHIKSNAYVKKQSISTTSFLVYSISASLSDDSTLVLDHPLQGIDTYHLHFGQFITPQRNLSLLKSFYFDYDLSINNQNEYESRNRYQEGLTQVYELNQPFDLKTFCDRIGIDTTDNFNTQPLTNFYTLYLGYAKIRNYKPKFDSVSNYQAVSSDVLAEMDDSCFVWIDITKGKMPSYLYPDQRETFTSVLSYKVVLNMKKIESWLKDNFSNSKALFKALGTDKIDFNLIFYPPSSTGLQLKELPKIIEPQLNLKTKTFTNVVFEVPQSLIDGSQKIFEVVFTNAKDNTLLFSDSSIYNPSKFTMSSKGQKEVLKPINLEPNLFEDISATHYPPNSFLISYELDKELVKYLANNLNYKITVRVSDLTSERK